MVVGIAVATAGVTVAAPGVGTASIQDPGTGPTPPPGIRATSQSEPAGSEPATVLPSSEHQAVGSTSCRTCHRAIYQSWRDGPHSGALEALETPPKDGCTRCHSPLPQVEDGVGCEACHGPGSAYQELSVMIDPVKRRRAGLWSAARLCARCHNPDHPFHVERDLQELAGDFHPAPPTRVIR